MVYAYPTNTTFSVKKEIKSNKMSSEEKSLREFCNTHNVSIVLDDNGKIIVKATNK